MCGFAGFLTRSGGADGTEMMATARHMAESLYHRGPDSDGAWADAETGIAFGYRRLAIIDLSPEGEQPMTSASARYVIVYNGEIYNFPELREELLALGHRFRGHSDTEVMLAAIDEWGLEPALSRFVGMFAFALWDCRERQLHLVRDRLGIKPLYYGMFGDLLLFGSELRALRRHPRFRDEIDRGALALLMKRNCIPAPFTIHQDVCKLPPATILTFDGNQGAPRQRHYWSLREVAEAGIARPFAGDEEEAADELEKILGEAVRQRMIADVPLGVFLSGGVDSSLVAALMQRASGDKTRTFSIGNHDAEYDEGKDAAAVAAHLGTQHQELYLGEAEALATVPLLADMYDEPFADSSQIPTYLISKMARNHVTVALSGDGGDEVFAGYNRYLDVDRVAGWHGLPLPLRSGLARLMSAVPYRAVDRLGERLGRRTAGDKLHKLARVFDAADRTEIYQRLVCHWQDAGDIVLDADEVEDLPCRSNDWPPLREFTQQMMYVDTLTYLPDDILTKVDRASMAVSLEARVPLIDHRVIAFAWSLPLQMKTGAGVGKRVLRRLLYRHVPRNLIERPKMGFSVPVHDWLRGPLREWGEALLSEERLRREGIFAPAPIRRVWEDHQKGVRNWQHHLWCVLSFQAWHEAQGR